jgi:hypothetical protein
MTADDGEFAALTADRPTAVELLEIIAATLAETVVPATAPHAQHQARVAANLCRILGRELAAEGGPVPELPGSLISCDDDAAEAAMPIVLELVRAKLAINKPGYDAHDAVAEADVVA